MNIFSGILSFLAVWRKEARPCQPPVRDVLSLSRIRT